MEEIRDGKEAIRGDRCHEQLIRHIRPKLVFDPSADYGVWKERVRRKFISLLGALPKARCPVNVRIEYRVRKDTHEEIRFTYDSEDCCTVPAYLLIPNGIKHPPVVICLQGHSKGMHVSLGVAKYPGEEKGFPRTAHALNAVACGFAALVIEQRGMGERISERTGNDHFAAFTALLLGRTIAGERVWDISRGIDALEAFPEVDVDTIVCVGNSGGGTATYYAAAFDSRIKIAVPSCAVCSYKDSIGWIHHCPCNYIPGALAWFDMGELACLIAPRRLLIYAGAKDEIFPVAGVRKVSDVIEKIYAAEHAADRYSLVITEKDHYFCHDLIWPAIQANVRDVRMTQNANAAQQK